MSIRGRSIAMSSAPLSATYHRVRRKKGHNVAVTALAPKLAVLTWHMLRKGEPYRYAPVARTRHKLRRVSPNLRPAQAGQVPRTMEAVYQEAGLPLPAPTTRAEKRATAPESLEERGRLRPGRARHNFSLVQNHEQEARAYEVALWRGMRPGEKYRRMVALMEMARRYKLGRVRATHPDWSTEQVEKAVREAFLYART